MADFGGDFTGPAQGRELELMADAKLTEMRELRRSSGNRPPKRPRGLRFGLVRRIVRFIRGGGD